MARHLCPKRLLSNTGAGMGTLPCSDHYMCPCHDAASCLELTDKMPNCSTAKPAARSYGRKEGFEASRKRRPTLKIGDLCDGGALNPVIPAAREEGVVEVGQVRDDALLLRDAQHAQVPLAQVVAARRLLLRGVAVQDVVIALPHNMLLRCLDSPRPRTPQKAFTGNSSPTGVVRS